MTGKEITLIREMIQEAVKETVPLAVKETVNGKIAALDKKIDDHMLEIKPYLQGVSGVNILASVLKWLAGVAVAYVAIKSALPIKF